MSSRTQSFYGLVTFDANHSHALINATLVEWGFERSSLHGIALPENTFVGVFKKEVTISDAGNLVPSALAKVADDLSDYYRRNLKVLFDEEDIDGKVYVVFSWRTSTDDSTSV
ncbi:hypothetical protein [Citrobacter youngae]|uniref:hypothetical protein n=1 Tax=Citrobacter youngae TaxID=133448 RepID=UPI001904E244|nr:hypothetical protein [Citrobacter youngae]MBJ8957722.1 hypothetical protein [Citrobacter youngae]